MDYLNIIIQSAIMLIALYAFTYQSKKDKQGATLSIETRINTIEVEQKAIKQDLHSIAKSIDSFRIALTDITAQIKMFAEIKDSLKDFAKTVQGINKTVAEHGIEIKNIKENIDG